MTKLTATIAAALISSASFAGAALADGSYYEGVNSSSTNEQTAEHRAVDGVSYGYTGSISSAKQASRIAPNHGDYYEGVNRPN